MKASGWKTIDIVAYVLLIIGALNWGLMGLFGYNVISSLFGAMTWFTRFCYIVIGLAALYDLISLPAVTRRWHLEYHAHEPVHA